MTPDEIRRAAAQLERSAQVLRAQGPKALRLAQDWQKSPLRASGMDPGRGKGGHADPTSDMAGGPYDSAGEQLAYLTAEVGRAYDAAVTVSERVLNILRIVVTEDEREGVGYCSCGVLADGKTRRLRNGLCPACDQAERRRRDVCEHPKQIWHAGVRTCCDCRVVLTEAGIAVK